ncbi:DUF4815 domain-containing protein [Staphylococcus phage vB_SauH_SPJ2]|nr:DUF4815 domain-containing protein [Staphylococcus phage vB_SauH_SPJ2]
MAINFKSSPYLDRFDPTKDRTRVLFNPDRPLQQSELNEMQSIEQYYLKNLGDSIFKDGDKQSGLGFTLTKDNVLQVNPGYVYINGKIRYYSSEDTVKITGVGKETVGIKLTERIITPDEDNSLLDQTSGVPSYFSKGADRLEEKLSLTVNDPTSATIYTFMDGDLYIQSTNAEMDKINKVLAERTYDESGSYKVSGFELFSEGNAEDDNHVSVVVDAGKAYVKGYKVDKPVSTRISVEKSRELGKAENESTVFNKSSNNITLANTPVKDVQRVTAQVLVDKERVTRSSTGDSQDYLSNKTAFEVVRVWTETSPGQTTKEYKQGEDYRLTDGQTIDWSPSGQEPNGGTSYYVSYKYNRKMEVGKDYEVSTVGEGVGKRWSINFTPVNGTKPIDQSVVLVDYTYYLARKDAVFINKFGDIAILKGEPNIMRLVTPPLNTDPENLQLGTVTVLPDSNEAVCISYAITRLSMEDLQKVKTRVDNLEYNQAVNALDDGAMEKQNPLTLRSVFSEGFISLDKADITHPDFGIVFSFDDAEATLAYKEAVNQPKIIQGDTTAHVWGRLISAPFTEERTIYQGQASETLNVNPYNIPNKQGVLKLTPSEDNWIDTQNVTITEQKTKKVTMKRFWRHNESYYGETEHYLYSNLQLDKGQEWKGKSYAYDREHGRTGTLLEAGGQRTLEEMIEFIRVRDVSFEVNGLNPNDNNLYILFDGVRCAITPATGYRKGSEDGTIMSDAKGTAKGKFTIPAGIRCGNREVTLKNANSTSATTYTAQGRKKTVQDVIIKTRVTVNLVDPLAQSFQYDESRIISSLGLYFASKGDKSSNVTVQIRGMGDTGYPNKTVYAETVINSDDIKVSNNASAETRVYFDDPMMAEAGKEYAIVIITENSDYTMWVGTRTKPKIDKPNEVISGNPYVQGVLFSSSNASTWTPHQNSDLKFGVYTSKFNETATIEFEPIKNVSADRLVLMSTYLTPERTGCTWEIKMILDDMATSTTFDQLKWEPIGNYQDLEVLGLAKQVKLKATFESNKYISPLLSSNDLTFTTFLTELKGSYIGRAIDMTEAPYNTIRFSYEAFLPKGTNVIPKYSDDDGKTWKTFTKSAQVVKANRDFNRYVIDEKVNQSTKNNKLQVRLDLSTENSFLRPRVRRLMVTTRDE